MFYMNINLGILITLFLWDGTLRSTFRKYTAKFGLLVKYGTSLLISYTPK